MIGIMLDMPPNCVHCLMYHRPVKYGIDDPAAISPAIASASLGEPICKLTCRKLKPEDYSVRPTDCPLVEFSEEKPTSKTKKRLKELEERVEALEIVFCQQDSGKPSSGFFVPIPNPKLRPKNKA